MKVKSLYLWCVIFVQVTISEFIIHLIKKLHRLDKSFTNYAYNPNPRLYEDLTPVITADEDRTYSETIEWALRNNNIQNVAITGPYGSGKSSILKSFESEHKEYSYLNISLASFTESAVESDESRQLIELSILQQIFYRLSDNEIPDSRFKRIKALSKKFLLLKSFSLIIWAISAIFIFKPNVFLRFYEWEKFNKTNGDTILYTALIIFLIGVAALFYVFLRVFSRARFNKLNPLKADIELTVEADSSILNKHLDEILYFFEITKYNVVIIEDLDRFKDPEIFIKLRELNFLVNNSHQVNRRVVFIYAIKDDVFLDKTRTKFFDFIIPVIPVINSSNSGEKLG